MELIICGPFFVSAKSTTSATHIMEAAKAASGQASPHKRGSFDATSTPPSNGTPAESGTSSPLPSVVSSAASAVFASNSPLFTAGGTPTHTMSFGELTNRSAVQAPPATAPAPSSRAAAFSQLANGVPQVPRLSGLTGQWDNSAAAASFGANISFQSFRAQGSDWPLEQSTPARPQHAAPHSARQTSSPQLQETQQTSSPPHHLQHQPKHQPKHQQARPYANSSAFSGIFSTEAGTFQPVLVPVANTFAQAMPGSGSSRFAPLWETHEVSQSAQLNAFGGGKQPVSRPTYAVQSTISSSQLGADNTINLRPSIIPAYGNPGDSSYAIQVHSLVPSQFPMRMQNQKPPQPHLAADLATLNAGAPMVNGNRRPSGAPGSYSGPPPRAGKPTANEQGGNSAERTYEDMHRMSHQALNNHNAHLLAGLQQHEQSSYKQPVNEVVYSRDPHGLASYQFSSDHIDASSRLRPTGSIDRRARGQGQPRQRHRGGGGRQEYRAPSRHEQMQQMGQQMHQQMGQQMGQLSMHQPIGRGLVPFALVPQGTSIITQGHASPLLTTVTSISMSGGHQQR